MHEQTRHASLAREVQCSMEVSATVRSRTAQTEAPSAAGSDAQQQQQRKATTKVDIVAKGTTHDLEAAFNETDPFDKDTNVELRHRTAKTQDALADAVEKQRNHRSQTYTQSKTLSLPRTSSSLTAPRRFYKRHGVVKEFDVMAQLKTQVVDASDVHAAHRTKVTALAAETTEEQNAPEDAEAEVRRNLRLQHESMK